MSKQEIMNRCPACKLKSLFIGSGGWLTCGNLDCHLPDLDDAIIAVTTDAANAARIDELQTLRVDAEVTPKCATYIADRIFTLQGGDRSAS